MPSISEDLGIDLRRLRLLADVERLGTIAAVAKNAHLTASAVSQQLQLLAREVGRPLLERHGRGVLLTAHGRAVVAVLRQTERHLAATRDLLLAAETGQVGTVRVGGFATSITRLVAPALAALRRTDPGVRVEVFEVDARVAVTRLDAGGLDLVVSVDFPGAPSPTDARYRRTDLFDDVMDVALPAEHALAGEPSLTLAQLAEETWVGPAASEPCGHILAGLCAVAGYTPDLRHHCTEWDAVAALVRAGAGISLVPRTAQPLRQPSPRIVPLAGDPASRRVHALSRAQATGPALSAVIDALLTVAGRASSAA